AMCMMLKRDKKGAADFIIGPIAANPPAPRYTRPSGRKRKGSRLYRCYTCARFRTTCSLMKLIGSLTSPYVRKVRIVMAEKKLDYRFELENVWAPDTEIQ